MTFTNVQNSARRLIAGGAIQTVKGAQSIKPMSASKRRFCAAGARLGA